MSTASANEDTSYREKIIVVKQVPNKTFFFHAQLQFYLPINSKLLTRTVVFVLNLAQYEAFSAYKYENADFSWHFYIYQQRKFYAQLSLDWKQVLLSRGQDSKSTLSIMDTLTLSVRFYVFFNSISVISGRWEVDNERLCAVELRLWLRGFRLQRPLDQWASAWPTELTGLL